MRLSSFNKVKSHWTNLFTKVDPDDTAMKERIIANLESWDYTDENNSYEEDCPEEFRDELVAWLRGEYL